VADLRVDGHQIKGYRLKSAPRGCPRDHPRIELLRHRILYAARSWPPEPWLHTAACAQRVRQAWRDYAPLMGWLDRNVGPSAHNR
jgi:hypothetical protein